MDTEEPTPKQDVVLDLNFVPVWARQPPDIHAFAREGRFESVPRPPRGEGAPRGAPRGHGAGPRDRRPPSRSGRGERPPLRPREQSVPRRGGAEPAPVDLPVEIAFLPARPQLTALVHELKSSGRAYPLMELAGRFLAHPEAYLVKIALRPPGPGAPSAHLYQCRVCQAVFSRGADVQAHAVAAHLETVFAREEGQAPPPAGNFTCVARCRLSGVLLGPPNHHGYNEKLMQVWRARFAHLTLDEYRQQVEMLRDPALIEKWKDEARLQVLYREKGKDQAPGLKKAEAEALFQQQQAPALVAVGERFILPAAVAQQTSDGGLMQRLRLAWQKESRYPFTMSLALRPAFRHMHLHLFKVKGGQVFVSRVKPHPLAGDQAVAAIREVLDYLRAHPGCQRQQLVAELRPGLPVEAPEVAAVLNPLRWLTEKGHVIEFFDGTLAVPLGAAAG